MEITQKDTSPPPGSPRAIPGPEPGPLCPSHLQNSGSSDVISLSWPPDQEARGSFLPRHTSQPLLHSRQDGRHHASGPPQNPLVEGFPLPKTLLLYRGGKNSSWEQKIKALIKAIQMSKYVLNPEGKRETRLQNDFAGWG